MFGVVDLGRPDQLVDVAIRKYWAMVARELPERGSCFRSYGNHGEV